MHDYARKNIFLIAISRLYDSNDKQTDFQILSDSNITLSKTIFN